MNAEIKINAKIKIFVKSSPLGRSVGIHWRNTSSKTRELEGIATLGKRVIERPRDGRLVSVEGQINTEKPSLVLARYEGDTFLLVSGIDGKRSRSEQMGRRVVDHILWLSHDAGAEEDLRLIAAYALVGLMDPESEFQTLVRNAIYFDPEDNDAFTIDTQQLHQIYTKAYEQFGQNEKTFSSFPTQPQQDLDSDRLRELAQKIATSPLPQVETVVIIAESKKSPDGNLTLNYKGNVAPIPDTSDFDTSSVPIEHPTPKHQNSSHPDRESSAEKKSPSPNLILGLIVLVICITLITAMIGIKIYKHHQEIQNKDQVVTILPQYS